MSGAPAQRALAAYGVEGAALTPITVGLINETTLVTCVDGTHFVLQRVNPIFTAAVQDDIAAITARLEERGVCTPRLVPTLSGELCVTLDEGVFRLLTYLDGEVHHRVDRPALAASMGALVARFHRALTGFEHTFRFTRPGPHDTPRHMTHLRATLASHHEHRLYADVLPVAEAILRHERELPTPPALPKRIIHGDLKVTNLMFERGTEEAFALLDLDTMAYDTLAAELGDALRSWCNPLGESCTDAGLDRGLYRAATRAYLDAAGDAVSDAEVEALPMGLETISLELASRFCADALTESYYGWDAARFGSRGEHNWIRARAQLALAESVRAQRKDLVLRR